MLVGLLSRVRGDWVRVTLALAFGSGCSGEDTTLVAGADAPASEPGPTRPVGAIEPEDHLYVTSTVLLGTDSQNTYVSLLPTLGTQSVEISQAREFPGWSGIWAHEGKLFVSDGEAPTMTRYAVDAGGTFSNEGRVSFINQGALFAESAFVGPDKAYVFAEEGVVWSSRELAITGTFELPVVADRPEGMQYQGVATGRSLAVRGNRTYVATSWVNWEEFELSEDSLIVVIDTDTDTVIDTLSVPCPYVDVASVDDDGNVYFSNWVYSVGPTLLAGKQQACAVRIRAGEDHIDPDWSLTFADVTGGREAAVLRYVGGNKALISVFHHEMASLDSVTDPALLANAETWRFWLLDLDTHAASPIDAIGYHAGGFALSRIEGRTFLLVPGADYEKTSIYELGTDGSAELRWSVPGWSMELMQLR